MSGEYNILISTQEELYMSEIYQGDQCPPWIERNEDGSPDYPMARNLKMRPECLGLELPIMPFADKTSAQRINMFTTSGAQALIVNGAEFPQVSSGFEHEYLKYTFNSSRFDQPGVILRVIPVYRVNTGNDQIKYCPSYLVIWFGEEDRLVHSNWVNTYTKGTNGFGWENFIDKSSMVPGMRIEKDQCLSHSRAVQGDQYCLGVNANTCYGTWPGTVEDAIIVSDEFTERTIATGYKELVIDINKNQIPINLYGNDIEYKFIPDIGEKVADGGVICGFRKINDTTFFADFTESALTNLQPMHDDIYYQIEPGATVVDIRVVRNRSSKLLTPPMFFQQLAKYEDGINDFYEQVIKAYEDECVRKGRTPAHEFTSTVIQSARMLTAVKKRVLGVSRRSLAKYKRKDVVIPHIQLTVTLKYDIKPSLGAKLTSCYGDKGTISSIWPKESMPVNDHGVRADILISPMSVPNRMNPGQLYMTFLSELCRVVLERIREHVNVRNDYLGAYQELILFYTRVNDEFANVVMGEFGDPNTTSLTKDIRMLIDECLRSEQIVVVVPPYLKTITTKWVMEMVEHYNIQQTPVEYDVLDSNNQPIRRVRTKRKMFIGKKYIYVLCKVPFCKSSGMGFVNNIGVPITVKDSTTKSQVQVVPTAIRSGEDEIRTMTNMMGPELTSRMLGLYANSPLSTQLLCYKLLTMEKPTQLVFIPQTNACIRNNSRTISALRAIMSVTGIDIEDCIASDEEMETYYRPFDDACNLTDDSDDGGE